MNKHKLYVVFLLLLSMTMACEKDPSAAIEVTPSFDFVLQQPNNQYLNHGVIIENNQLILIGTSSSDSFESILMMKMDLDGNLITSSNYQTDFGVSGQRIIYHDKNTYIIGTSYRSAKANKDFYIAKLDATGERLWETYFGGAKDELVYCAIVKDNHIIIGGSTESDTNGERNMYIVKCDLEGKLIWTKSFGGPDIDSASEIVIGHDDEIVVYGYTRNFGAAQRDFWVMKLNNDGESIHSIIIGGAGYEESQSMVKLKDGYLLCGHSSSIDPSHNMNAIKLTKDFQVVWSNQFGGSAHDGGHSCLQDANENLVFLARSNSHGDELDEDAWIVVTDIHGAELYQEYFNTGVHNKGLHILSTAKSYFIIGQATTKVADNDIWIRKTPIFK